MPTPARFYSSVAQQTTLTASITPSTTVIMVAATAGFPGSTPFTLALDYGQSNEELVDVTAVAGFSLTVTRAVDSTSATSHNAGAAVRHVSSGRDFAEGQAHYVATEDVHGVTGLGNDIVGTTSTQTLSNKTLTRATGTLERVDIYNTGTWTTDVIGDSTNPSVARFAVLDDETNLRQMFIVNSAGAAVSIKAAAETDGTYRFRVTDSDTTTDRFEVLAGGTASVYPTTASTRTALAVRTDETNTEGAFGVTNVAGSQSKFFVSKAGSTQISPDAASSAVTPLTVVSPASISTDQLIVKDSALTTQMAVQSTGRTLMNRGALAAMTGLTSGAVFQAGSTNAGYTGNLTQWVSPANVIVASITEVGNFSTTGTGAFGITSASGSSVFTAATGWSVITAIGVNKAGIATITFNMTRTGSTITADAIGNVTDTQIGTLNAAWDMNAALTEPFFATFGNAIVAGQIRINTDSTVDLVTLAQSQSITSGTGGWRAGFTYPV